MMDHRPQYYTLADLFARRLFDIPQYQRAYRWERKHRAALFSDIERSYVSCQDHFMATVVVLCSQKGAVNIFGDVHEYFEIVDGQQRITTLILLLKAIAQSIDRDNPEGKAYGENIDNELVKPDNASLLLLQTNHDASNHFENYMRYGSYIKSGEATILADRRLLDAMKECEGFVRDWQKRGRSLEDLVTHIRNRLTFLFHQISDEALVYSVFEVLNSRGIEVSWFDRLKTMLMSVVFQSSGNRDALIDSIHNGWTRIYRTIGLNNSVDSEVLRFTATLIDPEQRSRVVGEEQAVDLLRKQAEKNGKPEHAPQRAIDITGRLQEIAGAVIKLRDNRRLSAVTDIAHARLVATAINLRTDLSDSVKDSVLRYWENVTFRIFGIYGKDARTGVGAYVRLAWDIRNKKLPPEEINAELLKIGRNYPCSTDALQRELGKKNAYDESLSAEELRYFFYRYEEHLANKAGHKISAEQWNRIWESSASSSIEHILPQSSNEEHIHWLGNLTMLPPGLNSALQDDSPSDKVNAYLHKAGGLLDAQDVANRITEASKWDEEDIVQRENDLFEWAAKEWAD